MTEILDRLIDLMFSLEGLAIVTGLIASWAGTQTGKKHAGFGGRRAVALAFILAFLPCYAIWPGWGAVPAGVAVAVGLSSPAAYKITLFFVRKRWPALAAELSGDVINEKDGKQ